MLDFPRWERRLLLPESQVTIVACWSPDGMRLALKLVDCIYDDQGKLIVPRNDLSRMRPRIEIMDADGGGRRKVVYGLGESHRQAGQDARAASHRRG
jgi:hypothetical protein